MSLRLAFTFFILLSSVAQAQSNHLLFIGGGGEPEGETTIFDREATHLGDFLKASGKWSVDVSFNGGHATTENIITTKISPNNPSFTQQQYDTLINNYIAKLNSGAIKPGEQLLIQISSHGAMKTPNEISHRISTAGKATTDFLNLSGSSTVSLDKLKELIDLAAQKNVKLGIVDLSCHSGNSLALANPNTCIISSSGSEHFGWSGVNSFSSKFTSLMKPGKSLEAVFLEALAAKDDAGYPMISTPVGQDIQRDMYKPISPFLYEWRPRKDHDKLSLYLEKEVLANDCREIPELQEILRFSQDAEKIVSASKKESYEAFRKAINEYYQLQLKMRTDLSAMNLPLLKQSHKICSETMEVYANGNKVPKTTCDERTTEEIFTTDYDKVRGLLEEQLRTAPTPGQKATAEASLMNLAAFKAKKEELIAGGFDAAKFQNYYKNFENLENQSRTLATKVAREGAKIYNGLYTEKSKADSRPNPCKDFVL